MSPAGDSDQSHRAGLKGKADPAPLVCAGVQPPEEVATHRVEKFDKGAQRTGSLF